MTRLQRLSVGVAILAVLGVCAASAATGGTGASKPAATQGGVQGNPAGTGAPFALSSPLSPSTASGGTLKMGVAGDVDYMDPARTYYAFSWDLHQLINRTLLTVPDGTGSQGLVPTGDLATGPASPTDRGRTWAYTLKSGIKFQDGTTVTSKDIKYAIERTFATSVINGVAAGRHARQQGRLRRADHL